MSIQLWSAVIGYKVMRWDPRTHEIISLADARQRWPLKLGEMVEPRLPGLFLSPNLNYVIDHYASGDDAEEVVLKFQFDPVDITRGNLTDREPEISVRRARLIDFEVPDHVQFPLLTGSESAALRHLAKVRKPSVPIFIVAGNSIDDPPFSARTKWGPEYVVPGENERNRYMAAQGSLHVLVGKNWLRRWRENGSAVRDPSNPNETDQRADTSTRHAIAVEKRLNDARHAFGRKQDSAWNRDIAALAREASDAWAVASDATEEAQYPAQVWRAQRVIAAELAEVARVHASLAASLHRLNSRPPYTASKRAELALQRRKQTR